jgi:hypothetical protein
MYASVFPNGKTSMYQSGSMMDLLHCNDPSEDRYNLGAHFVAAYLNVRSNKINYLTVNKLRTMWHELCTYGYYTPTAGKRWYAEDVADYLRRTEH